MTYTISPAADGIRALDKSIDLCYMDPPYNTGRDFFNFDDRFKSSADYRDNLIKPVLIELHKKMTKKAVVVIHVEPRISHHIRIACDEVFGENNFVNEICWKSGGNHHSTKKLQRAHDSIIVYSKGKTYTYNAEYGPYSEEYLSSTKKDDRGHYTTSTLKNSQPDVISRPNLCYEWNGQRHQWWISKERMQQLHDEDRLVYGPSGVPRVKKYTHELNGIPVKDLWTDISQIQGKEKLPYATQKPVKLLERIIRMFSNPGEFVVDPFGGSGTTGRAALSTGREYQLFDINPEAKVVFDNSIGGILPF